MAQHHPQTAAEVGQELGVQDQWIRVLARRLEIGRRLGHVWTFTRADVAKLRKYRTQHGRKAPP